MIKCDTILFFFFSLFLSEGHDSIAKAAQNANEDIGRGRGRWGRRAAAPCSASKAALGLAVDIRIFAHPDVFSGQWIFAHPDAAAVASICHLLKSVRPPAVASGPLIAHLQQQTSC